MEAGARVRERFEDATLLALNRKEGATSHRMKAACRSWKCVSPERFQKKHSPADTLILLILDF